MDPEIRSDFQDVIKRRKPDVIVVGGFSILTVKLFERVREVIGYENDGAHGRGNGEDMMLDPILSQKEKEKEKNLVPVIWAPDQVARIFQHSRRATEEFASLPVIGRYCAGLARYVQSPLNEYVALGADISAISFHEDQQLVCLLFLCPCIIPKLYVG